MLWRAAKGECLWRAAKANASGCNKKRLLAAEGECLWRAAKANAFGGLGFRVQGLGFRVQGLGFAGLGFRVVEVFHSWVQLGGVKLGSESLSGAGAAFRVLGRKK